MGKIGKLLLILSSLGPLFVLFSLISFWKNQVFNVPYTLISINMFWIYLTIAVFCVLVFYWLLKKIKSQSGTRFLNYHSAAEVETDKIGFLGRNVFPAAGIVFFNNNLPFIDVPLSNIFYLSDDTLLACIMLILVIGTMSYIFLRPCISCINSNILFFLFGYRVYELQNTDNVKIYFITKQLIKNTMKKEFAACLFDNIYIDKK